MFDALLTGISGLRRADRKRDVPGKGDSLFLRLICNRKVGVAREQRVDLDEIHTILLERPDRLAALLLIAHSHRGWRDRIWAVYVRTSRDNAWTHLSVLFDGFS